MYASDLLFGLQSTFEVQQPWCIVSINWVSQ